MGRYYIEGKRGAVFLGEQVTKHHRTLASYLDTLLKNGFALQRVAELKPPEEMTELPGTPDALRCPMMLLVSACSL